MKKLTALSLLLALALTATAQQGDSLSRARGEQIVDNYLSHVDFEPMDSMLCIVSHIVERNNPTDTVFLYRWYGKNRAQRIELWHQGRIVEGIYSDGRKIFREFSSKRRVWQDIAQISFYDITSAYDPRGALYDWRSKGSEISYAGSYAYEGQMVDRVFVTSPDLHDRYYLFEQSTGLLFLLTEEDHIYGDAKEPEGFHKIDWRGYHEFTPVGHALLPSIESYQDQGSISIIHNRYHFEPMNSKLFSEDFHRL